MKLLITGSKGYVGSQLVLYLGDNYEITEFGGDILSPDEEYFKNIDWVLHLAAKVDPQRRPTEDYWQTNVIGTAKIAELCLKYNCKLLNFSSDGVFVTQSKYGMSKKLAEGIVEYYTTQGLKAVSLRMNRIGENNYPPRKLSLLVDKILKEPHNGYKVYETND